MKFLKGERVRFVVRGATPLALTRYGGIEGTVQADQRDPDVAVKFDSDGKTIPCLPDELERVGRV